MKKKWLFSIVGITALSAFGQGAIRLDNYNTYGPYVTYGAGADGALGAGLTSAYTMGLYYWNALGNYVASTAADSSEIAIPSTLGNYVLGTGLGSTAAFGYAGQNGAAFSGPTWIVPIAPSPTGGATITLIIVAYEGASYDTAAYRCHSAAFTLVTSDTSSPSTISTGTAMPGFSAVWIPEPSTLAFAGLGGAAWLLFRRRRA